jgi:hypothetical protein
MTLACSFCDAPVSSDWCPRCREQTGSYDPDSLPYVPPSRIERMLTKPHPVSRREAA